MALFDLLKRKKDKNKSVEGWSYRGKLIGAKRDWEIILVFFIFLNLAALAFGVFLFIEIRKGEIFAVESNTLTQVEAIDRESLGEIIGVFELKGLMFQELLEKRPVIVDPSE